MDLSNPSAAVLPSVRGSVLQVLAHTERPMSGRSVAATAGPDVGYRRVSQVLAEVVDAGIVLRESQSPAPIGLAMRLRGGSCRLTLLIRPERRRVADCLVDDHWPQPVDGRFEAFRRSSIVTHRSSRRELHGQCPDLFGTARLTGDPLIAGEAAAPDLSRTRRIRRSAGCPFLRDSDATARSRSGMAQAVQAPAHRDARTGAVRAGSAPVHHPPRRAHATPRCPSSRGGGPRRKCPVAQLRPPGEATRRLRRLGQWRTGDSQRPGLVPRRAPTSPRSARQWRHAAPRSDGRGRDNRGRPTSAPLPRHRGRRPRALPGAQQRDLLGSSSPGRCSS